MRDIAIIGPSFAGLTAALQLARASRSITVIDAGAPRNRTSPGAHGVARWDGVAPHQILGRFSADLVAYPTVERLSDIVTRVTGAADGFQLSLNGGDTIKARRIILAHGMQGVLPDIPGLAHAWGRDALHCRYCHGYEVKGEKIAVLATHSMSAHWALMLRADWSERVTLITAGLEGFDPVSLEAAGGRVDGRGVVAAKAGEDGIELKLTDGAAGRFGALFIGSRVTLAGSSSDQLGCALDKGPMAPFVKVGAMGQTSVLGVFAVGDLARSVPNINSSLADGAQAGTGCHASRLFPDFVTPLEVAA